MFSQMEIMENTKPSHKHKLIKHILELKDKNGSAHAQLQNNHKNLKSMQPINIEYLSLVRKLSGIQQEKSMYLAGHLDRQFGKQIKKKLNQLGRHNRDRKLEIVRMRAVVDIFGVVERIVRERNVRESFQAMRGGELVENGKMKEMGVRYLERVMRTIMLRENKNNLRYILYRLKLKKQKQKFQKILHILQTVDYRTSFTKILLSQHCQTSEQPSFSSLSMIMNPVPNSSSFPRKQKSKQKQKQKQKLENILQNYLHSNPLQKTAQENTFLLDDSEDELQCYEKRKEKLHDQITQELAQEFNYECEQGNIDESCLEGSQHDGIVERGGQRMGDLVEEYMGRCQELQETMDVCRERCEAMLRQLQDDGDNPNILLLKAILSLLSPIH